MSAQSPTVALLFEDPELGAPLRAALTELGARIAHEGAPTALAAEVLAGVDVVVVNLDPAVEAQIDRVQDLLEASECRVVFNDADASRGLEGWAQARWARHLAAKILDRADVDPPRPADARPVEIAAGLDAVLAAAGEPASDAFAGPSFTETPTAEIPAAQAPVVEAPAAPPLDLAEIEALFEELPGMGEAQPAQRAAADTPDELAAQLDALFADAPAASTQAAPEMTLPPEPQAREGLAEPDLDAPIDLPEPDVAAHASELVTAGLDDFAASLTPAEDAAAPAPQPPAAVAAPAAPNWDLVDLDAAAPAPPPPAPRPQPREFGVEKVSAAELIAPGPAVDDAEPVKFDLEKISTAEYLAPDAVPASAEPLSVKVDKVSAAEYLAPEGGDAATTPVTLGMSLELVPMEQAIAPQAMEVAAEAGATEMRLDGVAVGVRRVVALGASIGGPEAVREFIGALPKDVPATVVLAQHLDAAFLNAMVAQLAKASPLPVRVAAPGTVVGHGDLLVVPSEQRLRLDRGGRVRLEALPEGCPYAPSIDHTFGDLAEVFGSDLLAVVFSGMASDAIAGVLEVAARGGKVWAQDPDSCVVSSMVDGACEAGVVAFTGTPRALAARLLAELGKQGTTT